MTPLPTPFLSLRALAIALLATFLIPVRGLWHLFTTWSR